MERTKGQAFTVCFGNEEFKIKPLALRQGQEWRAKVIEHDVSIASKFGQEDLAERLKTVSEKGPELVFNLVASFLDSQTGDKVTLSQVEQANDEQLMSAYESMLETAFPRGLMSAGTSILKRVLVN